MSGGLVEATLLQGGVDAGLAPDTWADAGEGLGAGAGLLYPPPQPGSTPQTSVDMANADTRSEAGLIMNKRTSFI
jgi:hypothetical protein